MYIIIHQRLPLQYIKYIFLEVTIFTRKPDFSSLNYKSKYNQLTQFKQEEDGGVAKPHLPLPTMCNCISAGTVPAKALPP